MGVPWCAVARYRDRMAGLAAILATATIRPADLTFR